MSIIQEASSPAETADQTIDLTGHDPTPPPVPGQSPEAVAAPGRPVFTITEAATACAVSRKTITRKLADLAEHGAAKDADGVWRIPVEALLAVGLHPGRSLPERQVDAPNPSRPADPTAVVAPRPVQPTGPDMITVSRDRWDDLRIRLARAEAQAVERDLALADARLALRALTAGPTTAQPTVVPNMPAAPIAGAQPESVPPAPAGATPLAAGGAADAAGADGTPTPVGAVIGHQVPDSAATGRASSGTGSAPIGVGGGTPLGTGVTPTLSQARSEAARTGGYVPAANQPAKRRRWWQGK